MSDNFHDQLLYFLSSYAMFKQNDRDTRAEGPLYDPNFSINTYIEDMMAQLANVSHISDIEVKSENRQEVTLEITGLNETDRQSMCRFLKIAPNDAEPTLFKVPMTFMTHLLKNIENITKERLNKEPEKIMPYVNTNYGIITLSSFAVLLDWFAVSSPEFKKFGERLHTIEKTYIIDKKDDIYIDNDLYLKAQPEIKKLFADLHNLTEKLEDKKACKDLNVFIDHFENIANVTLLKIQLTPKSLHTQSPVVSNHHAGLFNSPAFRPINTLISKGLRQ